MSNVILKAAQNTPEDAHLVMLWRNDPLTRSMSFHQEEKRWPGFWEEYQSDYFPCPVLAPQFGWLAKERVGFLRFRPLDNTQQHCDISINLAPSERGKGLGKELLRAAEIHLRRQGVTEVIAEVKENNVISQHLFVKAGYQLLESIEKLIEDSKERVLIRRYQLLL